MIRGLKIWFSKHHTIHRRAYIRGLLVEKMARIWLQSKGYAILAQRYVTPVGEIDLIARRGHTLHFIEVKLRKTFEDAAEAIRPFQQKRLQRAALYYLKYSKFIGDSYQFDAILAKRSFKMIHLKGAIYPPLPRNF